MRILKSKRLIGGMSKMTELKGLLLIDSNDKSNVIISGVIMYVTVP